MPHKVKAIVEEAKKLNIPLTVPQKMREQYRKNYLDATCSSGRLFLFAGDQKIEHLNSDFCGEGIPVECNSPEHLFSIAEEARIGVFATQLGLIARYADNYRNVNYLVKLNGKSNLVSTQQQDPYSMSFTSIAQVAEFKQRSGLNVVGVGYTLYLGSKYEHQMLKEAAQAIYEAHSLGLIAIIWAYPRGESVEQERSPEIIAGAAGVAACLGADFVKVNVPDGKDGFEQAQLLEQAVCAAGRTKVICSGGSKTNEQEFLAHLYHQIHVGGARGAAIGRNIHQKTLGEAVKFCASAAAIILDDASFDNAKELLK